MFKFAGKVLSLSAASLMVTTAISSAQTMDELVAAAKAEGQLTTIALPHDWCGYGDAIAGFKAKYPEITVNELNPDAGSSDEIEAIKANKDNKGPQAPDVIDVGLSYGPQAKADGLEWLLVATRVCLIAFLVFSLFADLWDLVFSYFLLALAAVMIQRYVPVPAAAAAGYHSPRGATPVPA